MTEWKKVKLGDVVQLIGGGTPKTSVSEYWNGSIPWLSVKDFNNDLRYVYSTEKTITELGLNNSSTKLLEKNDIIISARGTVGELAMIPFPMAFNQSCYGIRAKNTIDNDFLYYLLKANIFILKKNTHGSVFDTITTETLLNLPISLPSLSTQKKIAEVLSCLDAQIELNRRINENLEQQAQAIFKEWFVDNAKAGWKRGNLLDIADYLNGLAMQKFPPAENEVGLPVLKIKELRQTFCDESSDRCSSNINEKYIINDGDVIFSWSGTLLLDFWCGGKCGLNQHLFKVTSNKFDKWFYYCWTNYHLEKFIHVAADKATTMGHIKRDELEKSEVLIPDDETYKKVDKLISSLYSMIISNRVENIKLAEIRDTLLPKLMNGELEV